MYLEGKLEYDDGYECRQGCLGLQRHDALVII